MLKSKAVDYLIAILVLIILVIDSVHYMWFGGDVKEMVVVAFYMLWRVYFWVVVQEGERDAQK